LYSNAVLSSALHRLMPRPGEELRRRAPAGFPLEIDVGQRLPVGVADDVAGVGLLTTLSA